MLRDVENATINSSGRCAVWRAGQAEKSRAGRFAGRFAGISQSGSRVRMWEATWLCHHCKNHDKPIIPVENQKTSYVMLSRSK